VERSLMELSRIVSSPVPKILLVDAAQQMKMSIVTREHNSVRWNIFQDGLARCLAVEPVTFLKFLYGWNLRSACNILLTLRSDIPKARACLMAEHHGDLVTAYLTAAIFSGVRTLRGLLDNFFFKAEPVCLKFLTHINIVFLLGCYLS
jgi:hypothetical protein